MTRNAVFVAVAVAVAALAAGALAQEALRWIGAVPSHHSLERYDMSVGVTASQQPRRPVRFDENREVLNVPAHYGALVGVTGDSSATVFWFKDADGSLRNAVVRDAGARTLKIQCVASSRYEADEREEQR